MSLVAIIMSCPFVAYAAELTVVSGSTKPWWFWPLVLFFFCLILGVLAVMAGVGGGVLYVPLVSGFFPFHIDFVRGIGLMVALAGALKQLLAEDASVVTISISTTRMASENYGFMAPIKAAFRTPPTAFRMKKDWSETIS